MLTVLFKLVVLGALALEQPESPPPSTLAPAVVDAEAEPAPEVRKSLLSQAQAAEQGAAAQDSAPAKPADAPSADGNPASAAAGSPQSEGVQRKLNELNRREQTIKSMEKDVEAKLIRLQELDAKLTRMLEEANQIRDQKLKHLIDVYTNMKAKQAATVLETLDEKIAVKILAGMRGRQAGEILTYVNAEKAARLSEQLTRMQTSF